MRPVKFINDQDFQQFRIIQICFSCVRYFVEFIGEFIFFFSSIHHALVCNSQRVSATSLNNCKSVKFSSRLIFSASVISAFQFIETTQTGKMSNVNCISSLLSCRSLTLFEIFCRSRMLISVLKTILSCQKVFSIICILRNKTSCFFINCPFLIMQFVVFFFCHQSQIAWQVIQFISINMVNNFTVFKSSSNQIFHNQYVFFYTSI